MLKLPSSGEAEISALLKDKKHVGVCLEVWYLLQNFIACLPPIFLTTEYISLKQAAIWHRCHGLLNLAATLLHNVMLIIGGGPPDLNLVQV